MKYSDSRRPTKKTTTLILATAVVDSSHAFEISNIEKYKKSIECNCCLLERIFKFIKDVLDGFIGEKHFFFVCQYSLA
jgi:hypothetical protein